MINNGKYETLLAMSLEKRIVEQVDEKGIKINGLFAVLKTTISTVSC